VCRPILLTGVFQELLAEPFVGSEVKKRRDYFGVRQDRSRRSGWCWPAEYGDQHHGCGALDLGNHCPGGPKCRHNTAVFGSIFSLTEDASAGWWDRHTISVAAAYFSSALDSFTPGALGGG
jgi:hypothetical protein